MSKQLSAKQLAFIEHYLMCWSAGEAAKRAGYSPKTAYAQGPRLLKDAEVSRAVDERLGQLKASADEVLMRLTSHSRGSMDDFIKGETIDLEQARKLGVMHLVKRYKVTTTTDGKDFEQHKVELELYDAQAATVQLGRALGVFAADQPPPPGVIINNQIAVIGLKAVDYRTSIQPLAPLEDQDAIQK